MYNDEMYHAAMNILSNRADQLGLNDDELMHYGRKGMKWGKDIFAQDETTDSFKDRAERAKDLLAEKASRAKDWGKEKATAAKDWGKQKAADVKDYWDNTTTEAKIADVSDAVNNTKRKVKDTAEDINQKVVTKASDIKEKVDDKVYDTKEAISNAYYNVTTPQWKKDMHDLQAEAYNDKAAMARSTHGNRANMPDELHKDVAEGKKVLTAKSPAGGFAEYEDNTSQWAHTDRDDEFLKKANAERNERILEKFDREEEDRNKARKKPLEDKKKELLEKANKERELRNKGVNNATEMLKEIDDMYDTTERSNADVYRDFVRYTRNNPDYAEAVRPMREGRVGEGSTLDLADNPDGGIFYIRDKNEANATNPREFDEYYNQRTPVEKKRLEKKKKELLSKSNKERTARAIGGAVDSAKKKGSAAKDWVTSKFSKEDKMKHAAMMILENRAHQLGYDDVEDMIY